MTAAADGRRRFATTLLLAVLLAAPAWAGQPLLLWQVQSETATVYMIGSIHVGEADFFPLPEPYDAAFHASDVLAVEIDAADPAAAGKIAMMMMQKGMLPGETTLQDRLEPEVWAALEAYAAEHGTSLVAYNKFHPGLVAMMLTMEAYTRHGFDPELGIDKHFLDMARDEGVEIRELETAEDQLALFLGIDDELDDILMAEMLEQLDDVAGSIGKLGELWKAGDAEKLDEFLSEQMGDDPAITAWYDKLLDDRNVAMAEKIDAMLNADANVCVVVGAGHFVGDVGVVELLEEKGWDVVQLDDSVTIPGQAGTPVPGR